MSAAAFIADIHLVVTQSRIISALVAPATKIALLVFAATSCGTAATNLGCDELDDLNVSNTSTEGVRRDWGSLHSMLPQDEFEAHFALCDHPDEIIFDCKRSHRLDLISIAKRMEYRHVGK